MRLVAHQTVPKVWGSSKSQNEDVYIPQRNGKKPFRRFVMCDGATTSFAGQAWAWSLARSLHAAPSRTEIETNCLFQNDAEFLEHYRDDFFRECFKSAILKYEKMFDVANLSYFKQEAFKRGSASTFLMLSQETENPDIIHLTSIGDTCCFIINADGEVLQSFPLSNASDFSTSAYLVDSRTEMQQTMFQPDTRTLFWRATTVNLSNSSNAKIICATDAVSQWIVAHGDQPTKVSKLLAAATKSRKSFEREILSHRSDGTMAVDDSTIAILER